ncbi:MAG TPA: hypothetical protein VEC99_02545, partial [Clostridia bacterium]|nr:hypothetical protein [Clostridia bacterium]
MRAAPNVRAHTEDLRLAVQQVLSESLGDGYKVRRLRRRRSAYSSSCSIENLEVELTRERRLSLVFKDLSPTSLLETAQEVRPRFLYDPLREIETYRKILNPERFGTAICYGAIHHPDLQRYWLFLERVEGCLLWQVGHMETWRRAAQWMARLHTEFSTAQNGENRAKLAHLLEYDRQLFGVWLERAENYLRARPAGECAKVSRRFSRLAAGYGRVIDRLLA